MGRSTLANLSPLDLSDPGRQLWLYLRQDKDEGEGEGDGNRVKTRVQSRGCESKCKKTKWSGTEKWNKLE